MVVKKRIAGEAYRPKVLVLKVKNEVPTVIEVSGRVFTFDPAAQATRDKNKSRSRRRKKLRRWKKEGNVSK